MFDLSFFYNYFGFFKLNRNLSQSTMRRKSRSQSMVEQHTVQTDPKTRKTHSSNEPGLRSMLYGLAMKMEKEEAAMKKRQKKQLGANACQVMTSKWTPRWEPRVL
ncbi:hypothetical protein QR680_000187 [Steinernema hermaphroditum]|uniref:Uncharacterized protein n=1 Tax=Steinernema hermaphroditum TaxID=289476 RepID=A0AA39LD61_9BILA|nr:hypothetical protein QR680_000187 [Steinernema hermaphroditum]